MMDLDEERLFGWDMRHKPPLTILPAMRYCYQDMFNKRDYDSMRSRRKKELEVFADLFDSAGVLGGDYIEMPNCWRYVIHTWNLGRIEIDVFLENYLILPEECYREKVIKKLNKAGYFYQIVGDEEFIRIERNEKRKEKFND